MYACTLVQSTKAVQSARRGGPPPERWSRTIFTPVVAGTPESSQPDPDSDRNLNRNLNVALHHPSTQDVADHPYGDDPHRQEGKARLRSGSISPIQHQGSSDDDSDSSSSSSSDRKSQLLA